MATDLDPAARFLRKNGGCFGLPDYGALICSMIFASRSDGSEISGIPVLNHVGVAGEATTPLGNTNFGHGRFITRRGRLWVRFCHGVPLHHHEPNFGEILLSAELLCVEENGPFAGVRLLLKK